MKDKNLLIIIIILIAVIIGLYFLGNKNSNSSEEEIFSCPKEPFINCRPPITKQIALYCVPGVYYDWIKENCDTIFVT